MPVPKVLRVNCRTKKTHLDDLTPGEYQARFNPQRLAKITAQQEAAALREAAEETARATLSAWHGSAGGLPEVIEAVEALIVLADV